MRYTQLFAHAEPGSPLAVVDGRLAGAGFEWEVRGG